MNEKDTATAWQLSQLLCSIDVESGPLRAANFLVSQGVTIKTEGDWKWRKVQKPEAPDMGGGFYEDEELYCTACNEADSHESRSNFCPNCGAEMRNAIRKGGIPIESDAE